MRGLRRECRRRGASRSLVVRCSWLPPFDEGGVSDQVDQQLLEVAAALQEGLVRFAGPAESIKRVRDAGITCDATTVDAGDTANLGTMKAHTVYAKPPAGLPEDDIAPPDVNHLGYVIETGGVRVYISGDPVNTFGNYEELLAPIRDLKPDIGFLTNHPLEGEFPFFDGSAKIASALNLKTAVPTHYSCFVTRDYDPQEWAAGLQGVEPLIIPYNQAVVYSP